MTSNEIRKQFLDFFQSKQHRIVPSAPVVPHGDPTLLFTNAGMNQFKDVFLGVGNRDYNRAADTQKCIRVSGKHNDLEEVGVDTYHHTFFEMLGNWSFGDYYKAEAIEWAWELLTDVWKLDKNRLYATVYRTDDEAYQIWKKYLPEERILRFDEKDNFWEMGETGPCGPCSEIHYDGTADLSGRDLVNASDPNVIEIWNLVFIQYNRKLDGSLEPLANTHVDTGMGFERITRVIQGKSSNYDTDVFMPLINEIAKLAKIPYTGSLDNKNDIAMRVIADHIRTLSFSIADGALPGNEGRGYVLRRILRRAARFSRNLGFNQPILFKLLPILIESMGSVFPELVNQRTTIEKVIFSEEESFLNTLDNGLKKFDEIVEKLGDNKEIAGEDAFLLYDTYGFPLDLTQLIARERGIGVDENGFNINMKEQKERSRAARKVTHQEVEIPTVSFSTKFVGYESLTAEAEVLYVKDNVIVLSETPFYTESGGQVSDSGTITLGGSTYNVEEMKKTNDTIFHICDRNLEELVGSKAFAQVDAESRMASMRNHTATHIMHEALRRILGEHIQQQGSLVSPDYLRFDFNHFSKVSESEIKQIEDIVNQKILEAIPVEIREMALEEAQNNSNIRMYFGDKYGAVVRAVTVDSKFSTELCGGTHVKNSSEIGLFKITGESSIAAGIRRIEAITGFGVMAYLGSLNNKISEKDVAINDLKDTISKLEKELAKIKTQSLATQLDAFIANAKEINGIKVVSAEINAENGEQLRDLAEMLRTKIKSGVSLLATRNEGKSMIACGVTDDIIKKYNAGKIVSEAAKFLGGGGGGRPNLATAGAKDDVKLSELVATEFYKIVESI